MFYFLPHSLKFILLVTKGFHVSTRANTIIFNAAAGIKNYKTGIQYV
jgi:hypothetical protein